MKHVDGVTVVLPAYGVSDAVGTVLRDLAVAAYALRIRGIGLRVLLINGEGEALEDLATAAVEGLDLDLRTVTGPADGGAAYVDGFRLALQEDDAHLIATLDANGRHDATEIPGLVDLLLRRNADVVIGSRWTRGSGTPGLSLGRWVLGRLANHAFRLLTGTRGIRDATTSFRIARRQVVEQFEVPDGATGSHGLQAAFVALAVANGFRVVEGPIIYRPPVGGAQGGLLAPDILSFTQHLAALRGVIDRTRQRRLSPSGRRFLDEEFGAAEDLERLGTAKYFFDWVLEEFAEHLKGRVLEVGAGSGTISRKLVEGFADVEITALEPAANMFDQLGSYAAISPRIAAHQETLDAYRRTHGDQQFDAALYLNVLEHIEDDATELKVAASVLRPGGMLLVFGPAHEWLYSDLDHKAGHYRRYTLEQLRRIAVDAGFEPLSLRYFDVLGVPPYYLVYRRLRRTEITGSTMWAYDRVVVPASRLIQRVVPQPPLGKNVILVARKH
ncbi:MAG: methyltransferase [Nitriliruptorales bacterium]|nr:methyltransferase [Nitriliruptorales bacterium]